MGNKRANGDGSVFEKRKNGKTVIVAQLSRHISVDGEPLRKEISKSGFNSKKAAKEWIEKNKYLLDEWEAEVRGEKREPLPPDQSENTFAEMWQMYDRFHVETLTPKVKNQYRYYRTKCDQLDNYRWKDITVPMFQEVIDSAGEGYNVRKKVKTVLTGMGTYIIRQGWARENLAQKCTLPKEPIAEKNLYTVDEIKTLWNFYYGKIVLTYKDHGQGNYLTEEDYKSVAAGLLIMLYSGIRPGELFNILPEDIDYEHRRILKGGIKTTRGKTGSIFFTSSTEPLVRKYLGSGNVYKRKSVEAFRNACNRLFSMLGMERHELSAARTTSATTLAELGTAEENLKSIMRHTDISTTRKYYDKSGDELAQKALEAMDDFVMETSDQRIEKYEREIAKLQEKILQERQKLAQEAGLIEKE